MGARVRKKRKRYIRMLLCCMVMVTLWKFPCVKAADLSSDGIRLEQAHAMMPEIELYYYPDQNGNGLSGDAVTAELAGNGLVVESLADFDQGRGIDYYFLLDISASIAKEDFEGVKKALIRFQKKMNENDTLTLITFGDEVNCVFEKKTAADNNKKAINALENKDMETALFDAITRTAELVKNADDPMKRRVAFVMSDGNDFSKNKKSKKEALEQLTEASLPVYALAVEKTNRGEENGNLNDFGEFSRSSGGKLMTFSGASAWDRLSALRDGLFHAKVLKLRASTNQTYNTLQKLTVVFDALSPVSIELLAANGTEDTTIPTAVGKEISPKELQITFSERVLGAEEEGNYSIVRDDGEKLVDYMVSWSESDLTALLSFKEELHNGDYSISFANICDDSMQANPVKSEITLTIADGYEEEEISAWTQFWRDYWVLVAVALTVLIVLLILLIFYLRIKKNKGMVVVNDKLVLGKDVGVKKEVKIEKRTGHEIIFVLNDRAQGKKEVPMLVETSLIVGRSEMCDLYFNDQRLSAQHFAIEEGTDSFYIQDLNSTNGTMVNGVKIHQRRRLKQGDVIQAGMIEMQVKW